MFLVPQPVAGSIALRSMGVPHELSTGLYLDEDIALKVGKHDVIVVAPDLDTAELVAKSLHRTAWNWRGSLVSEHDLTSHADCYAAWLQLAAEQIPTGELNDEESREPEKTAKTVSGAAS